MIRWIRTQLEKDEGFTLIELLIVVIIIGILAAIAIPTFLRQREKGWNAASESELRNAAIAAESYATDNNGSYAGLTVALLADEGFNLSAAFNSADEGTGSFSVTPTTSGQGWCMEARHAAQPTSPFFMSSETGAPAAGTCTAPAG